MPTVDSIYVDIHTANEKCFFLIEVFKLLSRSVIDFTIDFASKVGVA